jgi:hypothetical protein
MKKLVLVLSLCLAFLAFAQEGTSLRYAYEIGKTYNYAIVTQTSMTMEMNGQEMASELGQNAKLAIVPQSQGADGNYTCWASFPEMSVKIKNFRMDTTMVLTELLNKRAEIVQTPRGKIVSTKMIDSLKLGGNPILMQMGSEPTAIFKRVLINMPAGPVAAGGSWTETEADTVNQGGLKIVVTPNLTFSALGEEEREGVKCLKVGFKGTLTLSGSGTQMGANLVVEGEGNQEGTLFFAPAKGLLLSAETNSTQEMTIAVTGAANMTIPQSLTTKSTLTWLP